MAIRGAPTAVLTFLLLFGSAPSLTAVERLGSDVRPLEQRLELRLDPSADGYSGTTTIEIDVDLPVDAVKLHAREILFDRLELTPAGGPRRPLAATPGDASIVALADGMPIAPGRYRLELDFHRDYDRTAVALYKTEIDGAPYLFTQFEAIDARGAFPVFDEPAFKIPFELRLTVPEGFDALANTRLERELRHQEGWRTLEFRRTPPLPSYLVALAVGTFDFVDIPGLSVPGRVVAPRGMGVLAGAAVEVTPPLLAELERWFGSPYPYDKLDLVAVPEYWFGAMENPGAITFSAEILLPGPNPSAAARRGLVGVTAHELAHMWFGDYVTMAWWDDLWLNETFADWMADKIATRVYPELGIAAAELRSIDRQMTADARASSVPIRVADATPETAMQMVGVAYNKGKAVLGMIEGWIGEESFRDGVLRHLASHPWGNATAEDLWSALATASEAPVATVLRPFIEQPGVPLVVAEPLDGGRVRLTQRRFAAAEAALPPLRWQIPVRLRAGDGERTAEQSVLLEDESVEVSFDGIDEIAWLMPNAGPTGYYRWMLPAAHLDRLSAAAATVLTAAERRAHLANAGALVAAGELGADGYLALLARAAEDPDPAVLAGVLDALGSLREPLGEQGRAAGWRGFVAATLRPALERLGRAPRANESPEVAALRPRLLDWLGDDGRDEETLAWARDEAERVLAGRGPDDEGLATIALELAALDGDRELYGRYLERALDPQATPTDRSRFLSALTQFSDPGLAEQTLALYPAGRVRGDEATFVFGLYDIAPSMPDRLLDWAIENYPRLERDLPPEFRPFLVFFGGGCDPARFERAVAFFGDPARRVAGSESHIARVGDQVAECGGLRVREGVAAARFLAGWAAQ